MKTDALIPPIYVYTLALERSRQKDYFKTRNESAFQKEVKGYLQDLGIWAVKMPSSMEKGVSLPDLLCHVNRSISSHYKTPVMFYIEMKQPKNTLSRIQKATFKKIHDKYTNVYTIKSWTDFLFLLEDLFDINPS